MPCKMGTTIQCAIIKNTAYLGGGYAGNDCDCCTVMKLDLQRNKWTKLKPHNTKYFAMTSLSDRLFLIGGLSCSADTEDLLKPTNWVTVLNHTSGKMSDYSPMNIARHSSTAVGFESHIIVVGGSDHQGHTHTVEVFDWRLWKWYLIADRESLPCPLSEAKSALIGTNLYVMGGRVYQGHFTSTVHKIDVNKLIETAKTQSKCTSWQTIQDTPLKCSSPLVTPTGALLAVGGYNDTKQPSSSIYLYQPDTRRWVKVEDLPTARYNCTCSVLPSGEVVVAGGQTGTGSGQFSVSYLSTVDFLSIEF